ncbi:TPA: hypothetical protein LA827_003245 [Clostridium botulinum]|nr:hypothetical protein [Clostridium botulinum]
MINLIIDSIQNNQSLNIEIEETFERLIINASSETLISLNKNCIDLINSRIINSRDYLIDFIITINENPITCDPENFEEFWEEYTEILKLHDVEFNCKCSLKIAIRKRTENNILSIYCFDSFYKYISSINCVSILKLLSKYKYYYFEVIDRSLTLNCYTNMFYFYTKGFSINHSFDKDISKEILNIRIQNCSYANRSVLNFEPNNFKLQGNYSLELYNFFQKFIIIFSLISIFDISEIKNNKIELSLCGKAVQNFVIDYMSSENKYLIVYYEIFNWIYDKENVIDKLLIVRNVLMVNLYGKTTLEIPDSILSTIKSNFKIYIQDNYEQYVNSKTTAITTLLDIQKRISELSNNLTDNFFKNITMICTFIFTIIIVNPINDGKFTDIFTKDITLISSALILLSIIFLIYTLCDIKSKKNNLYLLQENINTIYNDILSTETLDEIVTNNEYYINSKIQLEKRINLYTTLWLLLIFIFLMLTVILGWKHCYYVFKFIYNWICSYWNTLNT